jgi:hypothetical protein
LWIKLHVDLRKRYISRLSENTGIELTSKDLLFHKKDVDKLLQMSTMQYNLMKFQGGFPGIGHIKPKRNICPKCQLENADQSINCEYCGSRIEPIKHKRNENLDMINVPYDIDDDDPHGLGDFMYYNKENEEE